MPGDLGTDLSLGVHALMDDLSDAVTGTLPEQRHLKEPEQNGDDAIVSDQVYIYPGDIQTDNIQTETN